MPLESQQTLRDEQFRPQVHFSPEHNWTNDPNGMVYFEGEYHLFFQYNPFGDTWGHMSWGHAVSKDLLHWQELPVAIPEAKNEMIFTGSVVVDEHNTSGLCDGGKACLVAVYTGHRREGDSQREVQNITSSQDRGRTWQTYKGNPVLDLKLSDFRDPSVSWSSEANAWVMAVSLPNEHKVLFYTSPDLKQWKATGTFGPAGATGGQWECPSLVHVSTVDGSQSIWALKVGLNPGALQGGSGEQYFLGAFDGRQFVPSSAAGSHGWSDYGKDSYCAINFNHLRPGEEPVLIGWMNNWQYANKLPTAPWRGQMTIPRRLTMLHDAAGISLVQTPILAPLRVGPGTALHANLRGDKTSIDLLESEAPLEAQLTFMPGDAELVGVRIYSDDTHWTETGFDQKKHVVYVDRTYAGVDVAPGFNMRTEAPVVSNRAYNLRLILDRSSIEAFAQAGTIAMTNLIFPPDKSARLILFRSGGKASRVTGRFWKLRSIWRP
jgi:sucrose-6-phosphate hydrolase SacC (GH32 family)